MRWAWNTHAGNRYASVISKFKLNSGKGVPEDVWRAWQQEWSKDEYKKKCATAKKNRLSEPAGPGTGISRHTGGSRSFEEHARVMVS